MSLGQTKTLWTDKSVSISTAQQILAANADRSGLVIFNNSSVNIYISPTNTTPTATGAGCLTLTPNTGITEDMTLVEKSAWYGTSSSGTVNVTVLEM